MSDLEKLARQSRWVSTYSSKQNVLFVFFFFLRTKWDFQIHSNLEEQNNFYNRFLFLRRAECLICFENVASIFSVTEGMRTHLLKSVQLI